MAVTTRRIAPDNAALLGRIAPEVFDHAVDPQRLAAYLANPRNLMILAFEDGEVVGQVMGVIHDHPDKPPDLFVDELAVTPRLHRRGIGRHLLADMLAWGREAGCGQAWVGTETDNGPARALYRAQGAEAEPFVMYQYALSAISSAGYRG